MLQNHLFYFTFIYTVVMLLTFILSSSSIPLPPHCFIPGLKTFLFCKSSHRSLPFFSRTDCTDSPGLFTDTSEHIRFLLVSFSVFHFLVVGFRAVDFY